MLFKDISYLALWWPLSSKEQNHLCNFGRVHHEGQFCEIILDFGPVDQEMSFRDISYLELWWHLCSAE